MTSKENGARNNEEFTSISSTSENKRCGKGSSRNRRTCGNDGGGEVLNKVEAFKKGPWTTKEDALLIEYVKNYGDKHWNCVQKMGLKRCGKSCRLRWMNHLRPDLKKGAFSSDEEKVVIQLHGKLGNKWSKIAAKLPGRTDNEVKNFWNTKMKRRIKNKSSIILEENISQSQKSQLYNETSRIPRIRYAITPLVSPPNAPMNLNTSLAVEEDPIMSFLNNPVYKFNLLLGEEEDQNKPFYLQNFPISQNPPTFIPNTNLYSGAHFDEFDNNATYNQPNPLPSIGPQMVFDNTTQLASIQGQGRRNDSPLMGLQRAFRFKENRCDDHDNGKINDSIYINGGFSASEKRTEELVREETEYSMDEELSSLLHTYGSPPKWC